MPVRNVLVGNARRDVKHDDSTLSVNIVTITETSELFLAGGIPHVKLNLTQVLFIVSLCFNSVTGLDIC